MVSSPLWIVMMVYLVTGVSSQAFIRIPNCVPQLAGANMIGRITINTATIVYPCCLILSNANVPGGTLWIIIANNDAYNNINLNNITLSNLPSYYNFPTSNYYGILGIPSNGLELQCLTPNGPSRILRLGNDPSCLINPTSQYCNGPLIPSIQYRVRVLLTYQNGTIVAVTEWSDMITLNQAKDFSSIHTGIEKHSPSMIIITAIPTALFAVLIGIFLILMFMFCMCERQQQQRASC
uniref:Uroplakin-3b-like protein n=1 Tax=Leptobrachium leishanense TaxID=445787 RepID=A0A8C5Q616_9ANUR